MGFIIGSGEECYVICDDPHLIYCKQQTERYHGQARAHEIAQKLGWDKSETTGRWVCPDCRLGAGVTLRLARQSWWQEIDRAPISHEAKNYLKSSVSAYLHNVYPEMIGDAAFERVKREIGLVHVDGQPLKWERKDLRLYLVKVS